MAKYYYNGVLLPDIPAETVDKYKYIWIRKNTTTGYFDLVFGTGPWYISGYMECSVNSDIIYYRIPIASYESATEWEYYKSTTGNFGIDSAKTVLWSNHTIYSGSIPTVYLAGSDPEPQYPVVHEWYKITKVALTACADEARRIIEDDAAKTPAEMLSIFKQAKIPKLQGKLVTENGDYTPDEGFDGLSKVTVNVPEKEVKLQDKTITENGTYQADNGYDGLGSVTVEVESGGSLEGLENGYDVMFYDENNDGLAFYSIKQGHTINPPVYACNAWMTEDGQEIIFPYKPSSDISCYAFRQIYADQIYEAYGVDKNVYPYLAIRVGSDTTYLTLYFAKTLLESGTRVTLYSYGILVKEIKDLNLSESDLKDITRIVSIALSGVGGNFSTSSYDIKFSTAKALYTNFAHSVPCDVISARLDV